MAYYGSDSGVDGQAQSPHATGTPQFYIGKLGQGEDIDTGGHFNFTLAQELMKTPGNRVYGYWFLEGPNAPEAQKYGNPYAWGERQGELANALRASYLRYGAMNGQTVFADIEKHSTWSTDYTANRQVINGFLSKISYPGIYSCPCHWEEITGSLTWRPTTTRTPVIWTSQYNIGFQAHNPSKVTWKVDTNPYCLSPTQAAQGFAGLTPTIWQYAADATFSQYPGYLFDLDIAVSLPD